MHKGWDGEDSAGWTNWQVAGLLVGAVMIGLAVVGVIAANLDTSPYVESVRFLSR